MGSALSGFFELTEPQGPAGSAVTPAEGGQKLQGFGAVLYIDGKRREVAGCSTNIGSYLGFGARTVLGKSVDKLPITIWRAFAAGPLSDGPLHRVLMIGSVFDLVGHWQGGDLIVECLPKPGRGQVWPEETEYTLSTVLETIDTAPSGAAAMQATTDAIAELSGFDRVMLCPYSADGHGTVVTESLPSGALPPLIGKSFRGDPLPLQGARRTGIPHRAIPSAEDGAALHYVSLPGDSGPHDLSRSFLQMVSEPHRAWLYDLGVKSTFATRLDRDEAPWGAILCHATRPVSIGHAGWTAISDIGCALMRRLDLEAERTNHRRFRDLCRAGSDHASEKSSGDRLEDAINAVMASLQAFAGADGVALRYRNRTFRLGRTPPDAFIERLSHWAPAQSEVQTGFETTSLHALHPDALPYIETTCGTILRHIATPEAAPLFLFRGPAPEPTDWATPRVLADTGQHDGAVRESLPWSVISTPERRDDLGTALDVLAARLAFVEMNAIRHSPSDQPIPQQNLSLQQEYFASAVHDLRAPLRATKFALDMMQEEHFEPQAVSDGYRIATTSGERMVALTNSILTLADAQSKPIEAAPIDMRALLSSVQVVLSADLAQANALLEIDTPPMISGDSDQIARLFENLISNAARYKSPEREPVIVIRGEDDGDRVRFCVADNGLGIAPEDAERIFKPLVRLHSKDQIEGVGLGLTICQSIVHAHGGEIRCEPGEPFGLRLLFDLPALRS